VALRGKVTGEKIVERQNDAASLFGFGSPSNNEFINEARRSATLAGSGSGSAFEQRYYSH
jgi:hypothetical protein